MLIFYATLFIAVLNSAVGAEHQSSSADLVKSKRGVLKTGHDAPQDYELSASSNPNARSIQNNNPKSSPYYSDAKGVLRDASIIGPSPYQEIFKQPSQINEQSPYFGNLFTMSAGYKVANDAVPLKQATRNQNAVIGVHGSIAPANVHVPVYKSNYQLPKASGSQLFAPAFQNSQLKKVSLPLLQNQQFPSYYTNVQSQPLILNPVDQFSFPARTPKVNNVQLSAPFLSPHSSFQSQVIPITTASNSQQFPQYKGAAIEVYPTVAGFSTGYQPLQTQPQLHFGHGNVQNIQAVGGHRVLPQEIRSDVEIINKKKPTTPPPRKDGDDDEEDDEEYTPKGHGPNAHDDDDDDYESKSEKHFKAPQTQGDFKPSTSFPFKQYDEKFAKYSNQNRDEEADEKPFSKYRDYSSSRNNDDEEDTPAIKYRSEDTSSKPYYSKQKDEEEDEEEEEDGQGYERQRNVEGSDDSYRSKYFEKDFDEEYEPSYRRESPKQKYGSRSSRRSKDNNREDAAGQGSRTSFQYHKIPDSFVDSVGQSSDVLTEVMYEGAFGYKLPENIRSSNRARSKLVQQ